MSLLKEGAEDYILDMPGRINIMREEIFRKLNAGKHLRPLDIRRAYPSALREGIEEYYISTKKVGAGEQFTPLTDNCKMYEQIALAVSDLDTLRGD